MIWAEQTKIEVAKDEPISMLVEEYDSHVNFLLYNLMS